MKKLQSSTQNPGEEKGITFFFRQIGAKIVALFEPEEVELTFLDGGKKIRYTYIPKRSINK